MGDAQDEGEIAMERHPFDGLGRVTSADLEAANVHAWLPPLIDKAGHLVQAAVREERRPAAPKSQEEQVDSGYQEGLTKGRIEGLSEGRKEGLAQGLAEGIEKGVQQGLQRAQKQVDEKLAAVDELMTHLSHALNEQDYLLEQALLNVVTEVSRSVVGRELQIDSKHILQVVRQALSALPPSRDNVRIFVNPADVAVLDEAKERGGESWRALPDEAVNKGGCRVETEQSLVDFTVERRFSAMIDQLLNKQLQGPIEEQAETAPEPVVKPRTPKAEPIEDNTAVLADDSEQDDEPGLLEQVEYLRKGVIPPAAPLLRSGT
jgi:flagellar assembly protein FliH